MLKERGKTGTASSRNYIYISRSSDWATLDRQREIFASNNHTLEFSIGKYIIRLLNIVEVKRSFSFHIVHVQRNISLVNYILYLCGKTVCIMSVQTYTCSWSGDRRAGRRTGAGPGPPRGPGSCAGSPRNCDAVPSRPGPRAPRCSWPSGRRLWPACTTDRAC